MDRRLAGLSAIFWLSSASLQYAHAQDRPLVKRVDISDGASLLAVGDALGSHYFDAVGGVVSEAGTGRVLVLDSRLARVNVFDSAGRYQFQFGSPGSGPTGIGLPVGLVMTDHSVAVFDQENRRIREFSLGNRNALVRRDLDVPIEGRSMCRIGQRYFVTGSAGGTLIHAFGSDGRPIANFGEPFSLTATDTPLLQDRLADSQVTCVEENHLLSLASRYLGELRGYSTDGKLQWRVVMPDFHAMNISAPSANKVTFSAANGYDEIASMAYLHEGVIVVQVAQWSRAALRTHSRPTIRSHFVAAATGKLIGSQEKLDVIAGATSSRIYTIVTDSSGVSRVRVSRFRIVSQ